MGDAPSKKIVVCCCYALPPPFVARRHCLTCLNDEIHLPPPARFTRHHLPHTNPVVVCLCVLLCFIVCACVCQLRYDGMPQDAGSTRSVKVLCSEECRDCVRQCLSPCCRPRMRGESTREWMFTLLEASTFGKFIDVMQVKGHPNHWLCVCVCLCSCTVCVCV